MPSPLIFTSMGMFIIDEIHYAPSSGLPPQKDIIGGGGTYATLGSRIITTKKRSSQIGFIIDKGSDFPETIEKYLKSWDTSAIWRVDNKRLTTRGWNMYGERDFRDFKYLSPKKRVDVDDLIANESLLMSDSFHLICSPARCADIITKLEISRKKHQSIVDEAIIVWEPVPDLCIPENLDLCLSTLSKLHVFTPNAEEAARFFGMEEPTTTSELESLASKYLPYLTNDTKYRTGSAIVLRCGALGSYTITTNGFSSWFPAYHNELNPQRKVVDPTGGGNTYIGSFATGFVVSGGDWSVASICGNIGAGIAIEQIGMPVLNNGDDSWNGLTLKERVHSYVEWNGLGQELEEKVMNALQLS